MSSGIHSDNSVDEGQEYEIPEGQNAPTLQGHSTEEHSADEPPPSTSLEVGTDSQHLLTAQFNPLGEPSNQPHPGTAGNTPPKVLRILELQGEIAAHLNRKDFYSFARTSVVRHK
jgi:hypothetical protein